MTYSINVTAPAIADLQNIHSFIAENSSEAADRILSLLESSFESLADFPNRCPLAPESRTHSPEIRQLRVGSYRVVFRIIYQTVHIMRVRHFSQEELKPGELN